MDSEHKPKGKNKLAYPNWGVPASIIVGVFSFVLIQYLLGIFLYVFGLNPFEDGSNTAKFVVFAVAEILEFILVYAFVISRGDSLKTLGFVKAGFKKVLKFIPAYLVYFAVLMIVLSLIAKYAPQINLDQPQDVGFEPTGDPFELYLIFVSLVLIPPVLEELVFRGFMFNGMRRRLGNIGAAVLSSLLFAVAHFQLNVGIDTFILGLASAWLFVKTKSIWPSIALHAFKNGVAFVLVFLMPSLGITVL